MSERKLELYSTIRSRGFQDETDIDTTYELETLDDKLNGNVVLTVTEVTTTGANVLIEKVTHTLAKKELIALFVSKGERTEYPPVRRT